MHFLHKGFGYIPHSLKHHTVRRNLSENIPWDIFRTLIFSKDKRKLILLSNSIDQASCSQRKPFYLLIIESLADNTCNFYN